MSCRIRKAPSCAVRAVSCGRHRGFTLVELLVVISIIGMLMALLLPQIQSARETARGNTCRNNIRALAVALFNYSIRNGNYPGYMNVLQMENGLPFQNPLQTGTNMPVSWAVMILPDIDRQPLFDQWRKPLTGTGSSGSGGSGGSNTTYATRFFTDQYIEQFICPSDPQQNKTGTPISYVTNSGQQDAPTSIPAGNSGSGGSGGSSSGIGIPRDWGASGMFFDNYTDHPMINTSTTGRGPVEYMRDERVRDPKNITILLTENIDAQNYVFANTSGGTTYPNAEIEAGCVWHSGTVNTATTPPTMNPIYTGGGSSGGGSGSGGSTTGSSDTVRINNSIGKSDGTYAYCRPSSKHPQMVNVAYVGQNVAALRENISYFIFAKMMATDDENLKTVGVNTLMDQALRTYPLSDADVNP